MDITQMIPALRKGKKVELIEGDIDEQGLEVGKSYYARDIVRARRLERRHAKAADRKMNIRWRRHLKAQARSLEVEAVKVVRTNERARGLPSGGFLDSSCPILTPAEIIKLFNLKSIERGEDPDEN